MQQMQVAFWNVGQGNATIIRSPSQTNNKDNIFILDAGSKGNLPKPPLGFNQPDISTNQVVEDIVNWIQSNVSSITVIISHPDVDHFNLINFILYNFLAKSSAVPILKLYIGKEYEGSNKYNELYSGLPRFYIDGPTGLDFAGNIVTDLKQAFVVT